MQWQELLFYPTKNKRLVRKWNYLLKIVQKGSLIPWSWPSTNGVCKCWQGGLLVDAWITPGYCVFFKATWCHGKARSKLLRAGWMQRHSMSHASCLWIHVAQMLWLNWIMGLMLPIEPMKFYWNNHVVVHITSKPPLWIMQLNIFVTIWDFIILLDQLEECYT